MEFKKIKVEVEFGSLGVFDAFEYKGELYLKIPKLTCTVATFVSPYSMRHTERRYNAVKIHKNELLADYAEFASTQKIRPMKAELQIYE